VNRLPAVGTRITLRYRLPPGSVPPLTDVIGYLMDTGPVLRVRTKRGDVVDVAATDVVAIKALAAAPVRIADIRNLEHAAAFGWPGVEQQWLGGWLLRFGHHSTRRANSAVPLNVSSPTEIRPIIDWYAVRGVVPLLSVPDRLFPVPPGVPAYAENLLLTSDLQEIQPDPAVKIADRPDSDWLRLYRRQVPVDVLTAVVDGDVAFATIAGSAVGRVAVTEAPDGTRWAGISAVRVVEAARRRGLARTLCVALLGWARERTATRAYVQVLAENKAATTLFESMGFSGHHRSRYVRADAL
jgi:N-acetylglutamate synthase